MHGFLTALFSDASTLDRLASVDIVATQNEPVASLGALPPRVSVVRRRFPARLRLTRLGSLFGYTFPTVDVAYGPFYYAFACRAQARVVTMHDLSCFDERFHPRERARKTATLLTKMAHVCEGVACSSDATLREFQTRWPHLAHKAVRIYCGVSSIGAPVSSQPRSPTHSILAVGTIEPRKNYPTLLDAFERLIHEQGDAAPMLTVVGSTGWMSESVKQRLLALKGAGRCLWLSQASDAELADAYAKAGVFTYLSWSEGFGYPPFEAAYARCPMVLSSASSVGEIWSGHARCVAPQDAAEIAAGWKWALALKDAEREVVVATQERRAREFSWCRALNEYLAMWEKLVRIHGPAAGRCKSSGGRQ